MGAEAILYTIGAAFSIEGANRRAAAEKKALHGKAALMRAQADERLRQLAVDMDVYDQQTEMAMGDARAGVNLSNSAALALMNMDRNMQSARNEMERRGIVEADLIRKGAMSLDQAASRVDASMEVAGHLLTGTARVYKATDGFDGFFDSKKDGV